MLSVNLNRYSLGDHNRVKYIILNTNPAIATIRK
jgi:hypothetical protein